MTSDKTACYINISAELLWINSAYTKFIDIM